MTDTSPRCDVYTSDLAAEVLGQEVGPPESTTDSSSNPSSWSCRYTAGDASTSFVIARYDSPDAVQQVLASRAQTPGAQLTSTAGQASVLHLTDTGETQEVRLSIAQAQVPAEAASKRASRGE